MLDKGHYLGYFDRNKIVAIAGTHIFAPDYGVSALGNIATHPDYRGLGIGMKLTSNLCHLLKKYTPFIGLNVKASNLAAIRTYGESWLLDFSPLMKSAKLK
jgi:ribosomal protein S18 acetylase RimI-like enzyme